MKTKTVRRKSSPAQTLAKLCAAGADDKKAAGVVVLDLRGLSTVTDYFVIATGTSDPHLKAISEEIENRAREIGERPRGIDGYPSSHWIVMDYTDVIVHIFHPSTRERYGLEHLWGDAPRLKV